MGEVASLNMGQSPPSSTYNTDGDGLPFLQGKAEFGQTYPTPLKWCSQPKKVADRGSVLVSVRAPVGDVNVARDNYCIGRGLAAINGSESLDNWFLFYLLIFAKRRLEDRGTGSTFKSINKGVLQNFSIPLPPLPEQRRIAHILSTTQRAIAAQDDLIATAREVKRSLMQRLFTYGPGPEPAPTKETEIGEMPEHWGVVRLDDVAIARYGKAKPKTEGNVPVVGSGGTYYWTDQALIDYPTLVIGRKGTAGRVWLLETPCWPADTTFYLEWKKPVDIRFLFGYLTLNPLSGEHAKTTLPSLQRPDLERCLVPFPSLAEQQQIAGVLSAADRKIEAEEQRKAALQELFKSMLQQLMTGQVRV